MSQYNSKYTGEQIDNKLDIIRNDLTQNQILTGDGTYLDLNDLSLIEASVHEGDTEPTNPNTKIWIDTNASEVEDDGVILTPITTIPDIGTYRRYGQIVYLNIRIKTLTIGASASTALFVLTRGNRPYVEEMFEPFVSCNYPTLVFYIDNIGNVSVKNTSTSVVTITEAKPLYANFNFIAKSAAY